MLDDVGWSLLSIKLFIQHFLVHPTIFSCWMYLSSFSSITLPFNTALSAKHLPWSVFRKFGCFFDNQNTNRSQFLNTGNYRQGKAKENRANNMEICVNIYSKLATSIRNISLKLVRSSTLNSFIILLKYPQSLLLFTHRLVFPLWSFSSSESISSFKMITCASARVSTILNFWRMNGL